MKQKAEEIYHRFVNYEWNHVGDRMQKSILDAIETALKEGQKLPIHNVSGSFISKFQDIIYSDLSDSEIVNALHKLDSEQLVCPECGNTGRCEPRTLSDPDGQECDCVEHLSLFPNGQYRCTKCWEWWHR